LLARHREDVVATNDIVKLRIKVKGRIKGEVHKALVSQRQS
jgi:hypothetical protein